MELESTHSVKFFNRGPTPLVRLVFFSLLSLLLLFVDARYQYLESTRNVLSTLIYPLQRLASTPPIVWNQIDHFFTLQGTLLRDNAQLRDQHAHDTAQLQQLQGLEAENAHLRAMFDVQQRLKLKMHLANVIYAEQDPFQHKLFIDLNAQSGAQPGAAVMDDLGIVGQVTKVYSMLSEVTLITEKDHEIPVQVLRNGVRTILFGSGDARELELRYIPIAADIKTGDILVTSGIDGTYPANIPVAQVKRIERDPAYPFAHIVCTPVAGVGRHHWLFVLAEQQHLPPRPDDTASTQAAKSGKKAS